MCLLGKHLKCQQPGGLGMRLIYIPSLFFFFFFFFSFLPTQKFSKHPSSKKKKKAPKEKNTCCEFSMTLRGLEASQADGREGVFFYLFIKDGSDLGCGGCLLFFSVRSVAVIGLTCVCDCD